MKIKIDVIIFGYRLVELLASPVATLVSQFCFHGGI